VIGIDLPGLARFFAAHVPAAGHPLPAELIAGGRSNLTYRVTDGVRCWVLRRPPLGGLTPSAHDMSREYRVTAALAGSGVPVPPVIALCEDPAVIGAPFSLVDRGAHSVDDHGVSVRHGEVPSSLQAGYALRPRLFPSEHPFNTIYDKI